MITYPLNGMFLYFSNGCSSVSYIYCYFAVVFVYMLVFVWDIDVAMGGHEEIWMWE